MELTDSNFDELVIQSEDLWLVEFFCSMVSEITDCFTIEITDPGCGILM